MKNTRRVFAGLLAALPAVAQSSLSTRRRKQLEQLEAQKLRLGLKKFYVTGFGDDCAVEPLVAYGKDRFDALTRCGITVWTKEEYEGFEKLSGAAFRKGCEVK